MGNFYYLESGLYTVKYNYIVVLSSVTACNMQTATTAIQTQYQNIIQMQFSVKLKMGISL